MEIMSGTERRRRWSDEAKLRILAQADEPGARIGEVARRHDVHPGQIRLWRKSFTRSDGRLFIMMIAYEWRRNSRTSVIKLCCAGWLPHSRLCVRGCSYLTAGVAHLPATKRLTDVPLPLSRLRPCARCRFVAAIYDLIVCASLATAHMNPASSLAMAVQTTVVRFPRAANVRYRAVNRL